jgi:hypothetical protein
MRTGMVDLPLHGGRCPAWLFQKMKPLAREVARLIIDEHGTAELLRRLADPMFFQALGCALGFDWHSSGLTTTTCGALKEAITPEMGLAIAGGKGRRSRDAPDEIGLASARFGLDAESLRMKSAMAAKVDSACIQAGYDLYHHSFFFDEEGRWAVVQQGMNRNGYARRYHWLNASSFVDDPPDKIAGKPEAEALNLVSPIGSDTRAASVDLLKENPFRLRKYFTGQTTLSDFHFAFPKRHPILRMDMTKKDWETLERAYELQPQDYHELVSIRGMGKKKLRALALLSRLIYGSELDWADPVKFSFAHGGKDGIPFPVDRSAYDNSISFLGGILTEAKNGERERAMKSLARLSHGLVPFPPPTSV